MKAAFYKGTRPGLQGIYSRGVRWVGRGPHSHVELVFGDGISASSSYIDGGVRFKRIDYEPTRWDIIDIDGDEASARTWFETHEGQAYDMIGTGHFVIGPIPQNPNRWFCSEAVAAALGMRDPWRYDPCGLYAVLGGAR